MQTHRLIGRFALLAPLCTGCGDDGAIVDTRGSSDASSDGTTASTVAPETSTSSDESTSVDATTGTGDSTSGATTSESTETGPTGAPPVAADDLYHARMDTSFAALAATDGVLANDSDPDGDILQVVAHAGLDTTRGGTVDLTADGGFSYAPPPMWWGDDTFEYTVIDGNGGEAVGTVHITVAPTSIPLPSLANGTGGFAIDGIAAGDHAGLTVSGVGDVDGDGLADVLVGAPMSSPNGMLYAGRVFVVFGKPDTDLVQLSDVVDGTGGFVIDGEAEGDFAADVGGAGDVNGDGLADLIVGAAFAAPNGVPFAGRSYVVFGKADTDPVALTDIADGDGGFAIDGASSDDRAGQPVRGAGDVDGDGLADLVIGAIGADPNGEYSGSAYVVFGKADSAAVSLTDVAAGAGGFVLEGAAAGDIAGGAVDGAGDVNGDGFDDLIVGAQYASDDGEQAGRGYIVFGKADTDPVALAAVASGTGGFVLQGAAPNDNTGNAVSGVGDIDGDGLADVIIAAYSADPEAPSSGRSYVVFGKVDTAAVSLAAVASGNGGFAIDGAAQDDSAGESVSDAGDIDGDGRPDILLGSGFQGPNGNRSGQAWIVFGDAAPTSVALSDIAEGDGGFMLYGGDHEHAGASVSGAGDVDGDGFGDIVIGADAASPNATEAGRAYVVFGGDFTP